MRKPIALTLAALGFVLAASLPAQDMPSPGPNPGPESPDNFHKNLFEPEMIMACQAELKLTDEQSQAIKNILSSNKSTVTGLEWDMNQAMTALGKALATPQVDENAALQLLDKLMDIERSIKRSHLQLAIQLKNKLTPEQQEILNLRRKREREEKAMFNKPWPQMQGRPGFEGGPMQRQGRPGFEGGPMPREGRPGFEGGPQRQGRPGFEGPQPPEGRPGGEGPVPPNEKPAGQPPAPQQ
jgi:Spy/CpxP family protein refolding chaperone